MKKHLIILSTVALTVSACDMHNKAATDMPPGQYEKTISSTDQAGTKTVKKVSTDVSVDDSGKKKAVVESKVTKDPKGLFNKTTVSKTKDVTEEQDGVTTKSSHEDEENDDTSN